MGFKDLVTVNHEGYATEGHPFPRIYLWWSLCTLYLLACQARVTDSRFSSCVLDHLVMFSEDIPVVEFMHLVINCMPGE